MRSSDELEGSAYHVGIVECNPKGEHLATVDGPVALIVMPARSVAGTGLLDGKLVVEEIDSFRSEYLSGEFRQLRVQAESPKSLVVLPGAKVSMKASTPILGSWPRK